MTNTGTTTWMLTTIDNPFNPFSHYDEWDQWDRSRSYHTNALFARICRASDEMSEADQAFAEQTAIDEIVRENVSGMHTKVPSNSSE